MEKLTIHVKNWLHREGRGSVTSCLLRPEDGKRCCLGIYLEDNCGVSPDVLCDIATPDMLPHDILGRLPKWLLIHRNNTRLAEALMSANDQVEERDEAETRALVQKLFAEADVEVEFIEELT